MKRMPQHEPSRLRYLIVAYLFLGLGRSVIALPERVLSVDLGAGLPQLLALQGQVTAWQHWQLGFGFGMVPGNGGITPNLQLPVDSITAPLPAGYLSVTPSFTPSVTVLTPFIRYFPTERNFYIEFSYPIMRLSVGVHGSLQAHGIQMDLSSSYVNGTVTFTQALPTLSLGHLFHSKLFFFNLSIGASFLTSISSSVSLSTSLPSAGNSTAQALQKNAQNSIDKASQSAITSLKHSLPFIPSLMLGAGFLL